MEFNDFSRTSPKIQELFKTVRALWKKKESNTRKLRKKLLAPRENRTHDPMSCCSDALATELLEGLWRIGSADAND